MRSSYDNTILASSGTRGVVEPREPAWYSDSFGERHGEMVVKLRENSARRWNAACLFHSALDAEEVVEAEWLRGAVRRVPSGGGSRIETEETLDVVELVECVSRSEVVDVETCYLVADAHDERVVELEEAQLHGTLIFLFNFLEPFLMGDFRIL